MMVNYIVIGPAIITMISIHVNDPDLFKLTISLSFITHPTSHPPSELSLPLAPIPFMVGAVVPP